MQSRTVRRASFNAAMSSPLGCDCAGVRWASRRSRACRLDAAHRVDGSTMCDGHDPAGRGTAGRVERRGAVPHTEPRVVGDIIRQRRIPDHTQRDAVHARGIQVVELGERGAVASGAAREHLVGNVTRHVQRCLCQFKFLLLIVRASIKLPITVLAPHGGKLQRSGIRSSVGAEHTLQGSRGITSASGRDTT